MKSRRGTPGEMGGKYSTIIVPGNFRNFRDSQEMLDKTGFSRVTEELHDANFHFYDIANPDPRALLAPQAI